MTERLERDRPRLAVTLGARRPLGRVTSLRPAGDAHGGGRRVTKLRFESGLTLIYKPHPVGLEVIWGRAVGWLAARSGLGPFRTPAILARTGYGWIEYLRPRRPASPAGEERLARRAGALLALLDILEVRDVHRDNLIAVGEQPVLVDAETLAHPRFAPFERVPSLALSGFVPSPDRADDRSGLGGLLPDPAPHLGALIDGYRLGFGAIARHRTELLGPRGALRGLAGQPTRVILRPTESYSSGMKRGLEWPGPDAPPLPLPTRCRGAIVAAERRALARGDVPLFQAIASKTDLLSDGRVIVPGCFRRSALSWIADRLERLSPLEEAANLEVLQGTAAVAALARLALGPR